jgi:hypothetical protein
MTPILIRALLRLYPRPWRDVHGEELEQLTEDLLDDPRESSWQIAASVALGAAREHARPKYLTGGRLVGLGIVSAVVAVAGLGLAEFVTKGPAAPAFPATALAPGRVATLTGMEAILHAHHVQVKVNDDVIPLPEIAGGAVGFAGAHATYLRRLVRQGSFEVPVMRFSPVAALRRGIAYQVLSDLAVRQARRDGHVVSLPAARAFAQKEYAVWRNHPTPLRTETGAQAFLTADDVAAYRQELTIDKELAAIAGSQDGTDRTPALRRWMTRQLRQNSVVIDGVPGLNVSDLASSLPPNL